MAFINWSDKFDVGVEQLNNQHKHLVEQINKLHQAMSEGKGRVIVKEILLDVLDYTQYHFESEEKTLDSYKYPGLDEHKKEHSALLEQASELRKNAESNTFMLSIQVMDLLNDWITTHILKEDMLYKDFLEKNKRS